jgi:hypothetical protein
MKGFVGNIEGLKTVIPFIPPKYIFHGKQREESHILYPQKSLWRYITLIIWKVQNR